MARILTILLGLAVVFGAAYYVVTHRTGSADPGNVEGPGAPSEAKRTLDNVHKAADRVEEDMKRRAQQDDAMQKAAGQ